MPVMISAVVFVVVLYIIVALGATFIGGAVSLVDFKAIALSITAQKAFGQTGVIIMTVAAGFATAAAINSTLFSTANLTKTSLRPTNSRNGSSTPTERTYPIGPLSCWVPWPV